MTRKKACLNMTITRQLIHSWIKQKNILPITTSMTIHGAVQPKEQSIMMLKQEGPFPDLLWQPALSFRLWWHVLLLQSMPQNTEQSIQQLTQPNTFLPMVSYN